MRERLGSGTETGGAGVEGEERGRSPDAGMKREDGGRSRVSP